MKKMSAFFAIVIVAALKSQVVSDYSYVVVPQEFADFKNSKTFGLTALLAKSLKSKKYQVLSDAKTNWPADALTNPCKVLTADVQDDKSMFRNKVILELRDCNSKIILTQKGGSMIKEYEPGFQDALKQALLKIPLSSATAVPENLAVPKPTEVVTQATEKSDVKEQTNANTATQTTGAQRYSNGKVSLQKIQIAEDQFILIDGNSSVPFATFKSTAKKEVYRVRLASGESTIGYYEGNSIVIEMPKSNGEFSNEVFSAK